MYNKKDEALCKWMFEETCEAYAVWQMVLKRYKRYQGHKLLWYAA